MSYTYFCSMKLLRDFTPWFDRVHADILVLWQQEHCMRVSCAEETQQGSHNTLHVEVYGANFGFPEPF